jgi:hypothetical protein
MMTTTIVRVGTVVVRSRVAIPERFAGATLLPIHDNETLFQGRIEIAAKRISGEPGPTMHQDQERVCEALAPDITD